MTHKKRFLAAVDHREPDRVPLCMDAEKEVWPVLSKALGVNTQEECYRALDIDEWMLNPNVTDPRARRISETEIVSQWGYHIREIKTDYEFIRNKLITKGFASLTGKDGKWIQARTKGPGHGSISRAFYARKELVAKIFESSI